MKPTSYNAPSRVRLMTALRISAETAETVRGLIRGEIRTLDAERFPQSNAHFASCYNRPSRLARILECLNELLEMHGVEAIGDSQTYGPPAEYLNAGDTYAATIIFDHMAGNFKVDTWGDWLEKNERKTAFRNW